MPDLVGLQDAITKLNTETLPRVEKLLADTLDRADKIIDADYANVISQLDNVIRGILAGVQAIVDTLPDRAGKILGADSVRALLDEYEVVVGFRKKAQP